ERHAFEEPWLDSEDARRAATRETISHDEAHRPFAELPAELEREVVLELSPSECLQRRRVDLTDHELGARLLAERVVAIHWPGVLARHDLVAGLVRAENEREDAAALNARAEFELFTDRPEAEDSDAVAPERASPLLEREVVLPRVPDVPGEVLEGIHSSEA